MRLVQFIEFMTDPTNIEVTLLHFPQFSRRLVSIMFSADSIYWLISNLIQPLISLEEEKNKKMLSKKRKVRTAVFPSNTRRFNIR